FLGVEIEIDGPLADAGRAGDVLDLGAGKAALAEDDERGVENFVGTRVGAALPAAGGGADGLPVGHAPPRILITDRSVISAVRPPGQAAPRSRTAPACSGGRKSLVCINLPAGGQPMSDAFLSSDDFDEQAHQLYNEGRYDEALAILNQGITLYPHAVELHIGRAYAHLAREEYAWARRSFDQALALDPDHEDGLAGLGETLLKLGDRTGSMRAFERILQLGFQDDHELMLQVGRALFREGHIAPAHRFFDLAASAHPESPDAAACLGYASHRLGNDAGSLYWLRRALELDASYAEARIYLANLLYDRGETEAALHHLERTQPEDHFDELGIWRHIELKKTIYRLPDEDPELAPWLTRLGE